MTTEDAFTTLKNMDRHTIKRGDALMLAGEAVLLFHGSDWCESHKLRWKDICRTMLPPLVPGAHSYEATTRQLCNIVRAAMERPE